MTPDLAQFLDGLWKALVAIAGAGAAAFTALKSWGEIVKLRQSFKQGQTEKTVAILEKNVADLIAERAIDRKRIDEQDLRLDEQDRLITGYRLDVQRLENEKADEQERNDRQAAEIASLTTKGETLTADLLSAQTRLIDVQAVTITNQTQIIAVQEQSRKDALEIQRLTTELNTMVEKLAKSEEEKQDLLRKLDATESANRALLIEQGRDRQRISDLEANERDMRGKIETMQTTIDHLTATEHKVITGEMPMAEKP